MRLALIWIPLFIISLLGAADYSPATLKTNTGQALVKQQAPPDLSVSTNLDIAIKDWITALSKERHFEAWKTAKWESLPVGPGTHSWLINIHKDSHEVGYLVVGAIEGSEHYKLLEYGIGAKTLFSINTLYQSLIQHDLIQPSLTLAAFTIDNYWLKQPLISNPLESFWRISRGSETYYLDGKSGELLLNAVETLEQSPKLIEKMISADILTNQTVPKIKERFTFKTYDPFDLPSWVEGKSLKVSSFNELKEALESHPQLIYMSKLYNANVIHPYALIGYHLWEGNQVYAALDDEGARYLPLSSLLQAGAFYP